MSNDEGVSSKKLCRICCEPIAVGARKCIHCDSFQDWRGNLGVSATVLSLLVALVSVLTASAPILTKTLTPERSDVAFAFQGANSDYLTLLVSNAGRRPASITHALLVDKDRNGSPNIYMDIVGLGMSAAQSIGPGSTAQIDFHPTRRADVAMGIKDTCEVRLFGSNFDGSEFQKIRQVRCVRVLGLGTKYGGG